MAKRMHKLGERLKAALAGLSFGSFNARLRSYWIPLQEVRAEAWGLGGRHRGEVLVGARLEAKAPGLPFRRAILLRAVIRRELAAAKTRVRARVSERKDGSRD